jgi:hypothetical protein
VLCGKVEDFFVLFFFFFWSWVVSGGNKYQLQSLVVLKLWVNESFPLCIQEFVSLSCRT